MPQAAPVKEKGDHRCRWSPTSGDGGNRTRVRKVRPETSSRLSRLFVSRSLLPQPTELAESQPIPSKRGLGRLYRHPDGCTPAAVTPNPTPPEGVRDGRGHSRWPKRLPSLSCLGSYGVGIRRCSCCIGTCVLPLFYEVEAPQPAVSGQPSPSKPVIPLCPQL